MLEIIAKIGLFFNQPTVMAAFIFIGFICLDEKIYGKTLILLLFTMTYNVYLKSLWQIPLPVPLEGWAFPSGHMHSAVIFWGSLALAYRKLWLSALIAFLLALGGYGLIHSIYHYPIDIVGALTFGCATLFVATLLEKTNSFKKYPPYFGIFFSILTLLCFVLMPEASRKLHVWQAMGAILGFTLGWCYINQKRFHAIADAKAPLRLLLAASGACLFYVLIKTLPLCASYCIAMQFFAIALFLPLTKLIAAKKMMV